MTEIIAAADGALAQIPQTHFCALEVIRAGGSEAQKQQYFSLAPEGHHFGNALSRDRREEAPPPAPAMDWLPVSDALMESDFWSLAAFLLPFAPAWPEDEPQREALARPGIQDGQAWPPAEMAGKYLVRAAAARGGIYGITVKEALYIIQPLGADGAPLDGSKGRYSLTFLNDALPPVDAIWSLTMYDRKSQLLVDNPLDRYLINSAMLQDLKPDAEGDITLWLQKDSPGAEQEANWLPSGPVLNGSRTAEPVRKAL